MSRDIAGQFNCCAVAPSGLIETGHVLLPECSVSESRHCGVLLILFILINTVIRPR